MTKESEVADIAVTVLTLDGLASRRGWKAQLMEDGGWSILLGLKQKMGGIFRDSLKGYTDESDALLITYYRNYTPILARAYLDLKKKCEEKA